MNDIEAKLQESQLENAVLSQVVEELQAKLRLAERRAREAEVVRNRAAVPSAKCSEQLKDYKAKLQKLKRKSVNDRKLRACFSVTKYCGKHTCLEGGQENSAPTLLCGVH